jgi:hypothetical protein
MAVAVAMQIHAKRQRNETTNLDQIQHSGEVAVLLLGTANLQPLVLAGGYFGALRTSTFRSGPERVICCLCIFSFGMPNV